MLCAQGVYLTQKFHVVTSRCDFKNYEIDCHVHIIEVENVVAPVRDSDPHRVDSRSVDWVKLGAEGFFCERVADLEVGRGEGQQNHLVCRWPAT